ncbi:hypothetical protein EYV94_25655 [Puteibacter caeruleilacunae]|nr:hypothetical protein EYV94_25655 [Puteibacter caeruleilacunae]
MKQLLILLTIIVLQGLSTVGWSAKPIKIACIGNSITYGAGVADRANNAYPKQLANMLGTGYEVKNFGVSGRTMLKKGNYPYWAEKAYKNAMNYKADIVFIKLGTNDSKLQNRVYLNEFEADCKEMIANIRKKNADSRIVLMLPVPAFMEDTSKIWDPVIRHKITPILQKVAYDEQLEVIDLYPMFTDKQSMFPDKIHPTSLGATMMAKRAYEVVKQASSSFNLIETLGVSDAKKSSFYGFNRYDFSKDGLQLKVVAPRRALADKPWVWRARFFGHEPQTDIALLERGYHVVYCDVAAYFGGPEAVSRWDKCYELMIQAGLNKKPALEGMSRGGLIIYNWAAKNLDKVSCIYADAPVLNALSWPGGFFAGKGSAPDWEKAKGCYNLKSDKEAKAFKGWPIHHAEQLAKSGIPMLHVCGETDKVVPVFENTTPFEQRVSAMGGNIKVIYKERVDHHPHSLKNPKAIVDFILRNTGHKTNFAAITAPGSEYRSAAGWAKGKGWWYQASQIDSLCQASGDIDLLLIGNSITQGWGGPRDWVSYKPGQKSGDKNFKGMKWLGAGISGDRTQHVLWRLEKGHYDACSPDYVNVAIGVNNFADNSAEEIIEGLKKVLATVQKKFPKAQILFYGPLPTGNDPASEQRAKYNAIHKAISGWDYADNVHYCNLESMVLNADGTLNSKYYGGDGIHLIPAGYDAWGSFIRKKIDALK